jgi:RimJ/RimL family protein N-acetyltransferase
LYLRALSAADVDGPYLGWLNDAEVCRGNSHHVYPYSRLNALQYVEQIGGAAASQIVLAIVLNARDRHIGNIALSRIHPVYRSAEFSILLGDRDEWGKGYALEASRLIVRHGFRALNLRRIECGTFASNVAMRKLAAALGMREEGCRRQAAFKDGRYEDVVEFGILDSEFETGAPA